MICSSLYRLFFMPCPPVQFTRELQFSLVEFFGGTSPTLLGLQVVLALRRRSALRAGRAIGPAHLRHGINANLLIGEVSDCI